MTFPNSTTGSTLRGRQPHGGADGSGVVVSRAVFSAGHPNHVRDLPIQWHGGLRKGHRQRWISAARRQPYSSGSPFCKKARKMIFAENKFPNPHPIFFLIFFPS